MESLAEELDTTVIELLSLEDATNKEVVKEVSQISVFEKENVLQELRIRSYLKSVIAIIVFVALIQVSKILNDHGIYGRGQMLTMGLLGFVGALIGMEIYTMKSLYSGVKTKAWVGKWKWTDVMLIAIAITAVLVYLGIQFFSGYGVDNLLQAVLLTIIGLSVEVLFCRKFSWRILRTLPLFLTLLLALWGTWCYFTSESWINAEFSDLLCGYITPFAGCIIGWLLMYRKK